MKSILFFPFVLFSIMGLSQNSIPVDNPPVLFEFLGGNKGIAAQMTVNKQFQEGKRLGFFSVANLSSKWSENNSKDAMIQANLTYEFIKNTRLVGGMHYTPVTGLRPTAGFLYAFNFKSFFFTINPRFIGFSTNAITEGLILLEYKPKINDEWRGYSRVQALYSETIKDGSHARSYLMLRLGVSYRLLTFGLGVNFDRYGKFKESKENYGIFAAFRLFR